MKNKSDNKIKILFINNDLGYYGGSLSLMNMYNSIKKKCHCSFAIASSNINSDLLKKTNVLTYANFGSVIVGASKFKHIISFIPRLVQVIFGNIWFTAVLCKAIKKHKIDIVHTNTSVVICGFLASKICGVKHVWHLREFIYKDQGCYPIIGFTLLRYLINKSDAVIPITQAIKEFYNTNFDNMFDAVFSETQILPSNDAKEDYILFCGSLGKGKQPEHAIEAFYRVSQEFPKLKLKIAGNGSLENELKEHSKRLNIANKVEFLGYVKDPYPLFNKAKAFLMTSKSEGMGRTTIEAMANDCVVIGYNSGGTQELLKHNETGFLYNTFEELINFLTIVLKDPTNAKTIRIAAKKWAFENCLEENYGNIIMSIYNDVLKSNNVSKE